jgi:hypothetical protein
MMRAAPLPTDRANLAGKDDRRLCSWCLMIGALGRRAARSRAGIPRRRGGLRRFMAGPRQGRQAAAHLQGQPRTSPPTRGLRVPGRGSDPVRGHSTFAGSPRADRQPDDQVFAGTDRGGFFTLHDHGELVVRRRTWTTAIPSGNSAAAFGLLRLAALTGEHDYDAAGVFRRSARRPPATRRHASAHRVDFRFAPVKVALLGEPRATAWASSTVVAPVSGARGAGGRTGGIERPELMRNEPRSTADPPRTCGNASCRQPVTEPRSSRPLSAARVIASAGGSNGIGRRRLQERRAAACSCQSHQRQPHDFHLAGLTPPVRPGRDDEPWG